MYNINVKEWRLFMVEEIDEVKLKNLKELIKDYVSGKISISDLEKANIDPTLVLKLDESLILKLFEKSILK